jgi:hypothetical protein
VQRYNFDMKDGLKDQVVPYPLICGGCNGLPELQIPIPVSLVAEYIVNRPENVILAQQQAQDKLKAIAREAGLAEKAKKPSFKALHANYVNKKHVNQVADLFVRRKLIPFNPFDRRRPFRGDQEALAHWVAQYEAGKAFAVPEPLPEPVKAQVVEPKVDADEVAEFDVVAASSESSPETKSESDVATAGETPALSPSEISDMSVRKALAAVGDADTARAVLEIESAKDEPRKSLIAGLEKLL